MAYYKLKKGTELKKSPWGVFLADAIEEKESSSEKYSNVKNDNSRLKTRKKREKHCFDYINPLTLKRCELVQCKKKNCLYLIKQDFFDSHLTDYHNQSSKDYAAEMGICTQSKITELDYEKVIPYNGIAQSFPETNSLVNNRKRPHECNSEKELLSSTRNLKVKKPALDSGQEPMISRLLKTCVDEVTPVSLHIHESSMDSVYSINLKCLSNLTLKEMNDGNCSSQKQRPKEINKDRQLHLLPSPSDEFSSSPNVANYSLTSGENNVSVQSTSSHTVHSFSQLSSQQLAYSEMIWGNISGNKNAMSGTFYNETFHSPEMQNAYSYAAGECHDIYSASFYSVPTLTSYIGVDPQLPMEMISSFISKNSSSSTTDSESDDDISFSPRSKKNERSLIPNDAEEEEDYPNDDWWEPIENQSHISKMKPKRHFILLKLHTSKLDTQIGSESNNMSMEVGDESANYKLGSENSIPDSAASTSHVEDLVLSSNDESSCATSTIHKESEKPELPYKRTVKSKRFSIPTPLWPSHCSMLQKAEERDLKLRNDTLPPSKKGLFKPITPRQSALSNMVVSQHDDNITDLEGMCDTVSGMPESEAKGESLLEVEEESAVAHCSVELSADNTLSREMAPSVTESPVELPVDDNSPLNRRLAEPATDNKVPTEGEEEEWQLRQRNNSDPNGS